MNFTPALYSGPKNMTQYPNASLIRRCAAILYDAFLIIAIWMISTTIIVAWMTDGGEVQGLLFQFFLYFEIGLFYIYFWHFKGQTLGMQVWKIKTVDASGQTLTLKDCLLRFLFATLSCAIVGLGFFWAFFNPERLTLHDIASGTRVIYLGRNPSRSEISVGTSEKVTTGDETDGNGNDNGNNGRKAKDQTRG